MPESAREGPLYYEYDSIHDSFYVADPQPQTASRVAALEQRIADVSAQLEDLATDKYRLNREDMIDVAEALLARLREVKG